MADSPRVSLDEIIVPHQELEDPRSTIYQRHPLASVLVLTLLAVRAGAAGRPSRKNGHDIEEFVESGAVDAGVGQVGEMVGDGEFLVGRHGAPPWCLGVEEENYQNYGTTTSFRQPISNDS